MKRRDSAFVGFCHDVVIGDDWSIAVAVIAALALTFGLAATTVPLWCVLPVAVLVVLPLSLWRAARRTVAVRQTAPTATADER